MRARRSRASAALAATVLVLASLLGMAHEATTSHVRCAAHGELVDSDGPAPVSVAGAPSRETLAAAAGSARGHGDEHCLLASALRTSRIAPSSPAIAAASVATAAPAVALAAPRPAPGARLYRIAPKTSPPA